MPRLAQLQGDPFDTKVHILTDHRVLNLKSRETDIAVRATLLFEDQLSLMIARLASVRDADDVTHYVAPICIKQVLQAITPFLPVPARRRHRRGRRCDQLTTWNILLARRSPSITHSDR